LLWFHISLTDDRRRAGQHHHVGVTLRVFCQVLPDMNDRQCRPFTTPLAFRTAATLLVRFYRGTCSVPAILLSLRRRFATISFTYAGAAATREFACARDTVLCCSRGLSRTTGIFMASAVSPAFGDEGIAAFSAGVCDRFAAI
jgi:hypothetical protein